MDNLYINGISLHSIGVRMGDNFISSLMSPLSVKPSLYNTSRLIDGKVLCKVSRKIESRKLNLTFNIHGESCEDKDRNLSALQEILYGGKIDLRLVIDDLDITYKLIYRGNSISFAETLDGCSCKLTAGFEEPDPTNRKDAKKNESSNIEREESIITNSGKSRTEFLGVGLLATNNKVYTLEEWNATGYDATNVVGIAIAMFDKRFYVNTISYLLPWGLYEQVEIPLFSSAKKDDNGIYNTAICQASYGNTKNLTDVIGMCNTFTFANGEKCYIGASMELYYLNSCIENVKEILKTIGKELPQGYYWSSTYNGGKSVWAIDLFNNKEFAVNKIDVSSAGNSCNFLPFGKL